MVIFYFFKEYFIIIQNTILDYQDLRQKVAENIYSNDDSSFLKNLLYKNIQEKKYLYIMKKYIIEKIKKSQYEIQSKKLIQAAIVKRNKELLINKYNK